jgi:VanZ family protein
MRKRLGLILWLVGLLFPLGWLGHFSVTYQRAFDAVFSPEWVHVGMHAGLYFVLGILLAHTLRVNTDWQGVLLVMGIILGVGVLQELFQLFSQGIDPFQSVAQARAGFDLSVDLAGGLLGLGVLAFYKNKPARLNELDR